ncbi:MAG: adenylyl cyclase, partial [Gammaproteobacteria bacterium]|nr:adenylyl cyclase [Gammaproteobacteria bacterium]
MSLFQELKRRNVFRVAVAYIIVAWLLLQVADTLGPALRLPEWFQSGVAFVVILGFLPAVIFAWAFELTPEGVKREREVDRSQSITPQTGQKLNFAIIALLALAVVYFAVDKFVLTDAPGTATSTVQRSVNPSIAVLPFVNMSDDQSNEYFADGITEELLNLLAKIPELDVTSRSSAFAFKGKDIDIPTVAGKLNVDHVLEGSVRKSGVTVRITAQLIEAGTDKHMWSETYDRELTDIFAIQDEIAKEVVDVLQVTLLGKAPESRATDAEAYSLYLEGLHYLELDGEDDWRKAQLLFEDALQIDPSYA